MSWLVPCSPADQDFGFCAEANIWTTLEAGIDLEVDMVQPRILVAFHSADGQSAKIAECISDSLREAGAVVDLTPVVAAPPPSGYTAVVLGDSIHMSRHSQELRDYLRVNAQALDAIPSALFQVSITSAKQDAESADKAADMARQLQSATGFTPDAVGLFAGALAYSHYGRLMRQMVRSIARSSGLDTDTTRDHEYTDWVAVEAFALQVYALATGHATGRTGIEYGGRAS